jgi:hypothetical protein
MINYDKVCKLQDRIIEYFIINNGYDDYIMYSLLDAPENRGIFDDANISKLHLLYFFNYLKFKYIRVILTKSKVINKWNASTILYYPSLMQVFSDLTTTHAFFSFYTHEEIVKIINLPMQDEWFMYNDKCFSHTFFYKCVNNSIIKTYMFDYLSRHNISTFIPYDKILSHDNNIIINMESLDIIINYEKGVTFTNSLRYNWIISCIKIV